MALGERFSASRFWDEMRRYGVTTFNGLGAVMPILMKQPERPDDRRQQGALSALGRLPGRHVGGVRGALRRPDHTRATGRWTAAGVVHHRTSGPLRSARWGSPSARSAASSTPRAATCPPGTPGELITATWAERKSSVEYYKNAEATSDKVRDGWLYTGDLVYADEKGYIYFVGRNTESMRCKGENVSAYEVEQAILKHPDVLECAVYAVPSELAEDEIMVTLVPVEGKALDPAAMPGFLADRLARFAVPRYYRVVDALPKTETHRVIKKELEKLGVTEDTYDCGSPGEERPDERQRLRARRGDDPIREVPREEHQADDRRGDARSSSRTSGVDRKEISRRPGSPTPAGA